MLGHRLVYILGLILLGISFGYAQSTDTQGPEIHVQKLKQNKDGSFTIYTEVTDDLSGVDGNSVKIYYRWTYQTFWDKIYNSIPSGISSEADLKINHIQGSNFSRTVRKPGLLGIPTDFDNGERVLWRIEASDNAGNKTYYPANLQYEAITTRFGSTIYDPTSYYVDDIVMGDANFFNDDILIPVESSSSAFTITPINEDQFEILNNTSLYYSLALDPPGLNYDGYSFFDPMPEPKAGVIHFRPKRLRKGTISGLSNQQEVTLILDRETNLARIRNGWILAGSVIKAAVPFSIPDNIIFDVISELDGIKRGELDAILNTAGTISREVAIEIVVDHILKEYADELTTEINLRMAAAGSSNFIARSQVANSITTIKNLAFGINSTLAFDYYWYRYPWGTETYRFKRLSTLAFEYNWTPGYENSYNDDSIFAGEIYDTLFFNFHVPDERQQPYFDVYAEVNLYAPGDPDNPIETSYITRDNYSPNGKFDLTIKELERLTAPYFGLGQGNVFSPAGIGTNFTYCLNQYNFDTTSTGVIIESNKLPYSLEFILYQGGVPGPNNAVPVDTIGKTGLMDFIIYDRTAPQAPTLIPELLNSELFYAFDIITTSGEQDINSYVIYQAKQGSSLFEPLDTIEFVGSDTTLYQLFLQEPEPELSFKVMAIDISGNEGALSSPLLIDPLPLSNTAIYIDEYNLDIYEKDSIRISATNSLGNPVAGIPYKIYSSSQGYFQKGYTEYGDTTYVVTDENGIASTNYDPLTSGNHYIQIVSYQGHTISHQAPIVVSTNVSFPSVNDSNFITKFEYWYDNEIATRQTILTIPARRSEFNYNLYLTELDPGIHMLSYRFWDYNGVSSVIVRRPFFKHEDVVGVQSRINAFEYWIDDDTKQTEYMQSQPYLQFLDSIDLGNLDPGFHTLYVRFKDRNDKYNAPLVYSFYLDDEQFFEGNKIQSSQSWLDYDTNLIARNYSAKTLKRIDDYELRPEMTSGVHSYFIRFQDASGNWSVPLIKDFVASDIDSSLFNQINLWEYWFDEDTNLRVTQGYDKTDTLFQRELAIDHLDPGIHTLYLRFMDSLEQWSVPLVYSFLKTPLDSVEANGIAGYYYAFNDSISGLIPHLSNTLVDSIGNAALDQGVTRFLIAFRDENGLSSSPLVYDFNNLDLDHYEDNRITGYRIGFIDTTGIRLITKPDSLGLIRKIFSDSLFMDTLGIGVYPFFFQAIDSNGVFSAPLFDTLEFLPRAVPGFTITSQRECDSLLVTVQNNSDYADNFLWDFGDGSIDTSQNPSHWYSQYGQYDISLTVSNSWTTADSMIVLVDAVDFMNWDTLTIGPNLTLCPSDSAVLGVSPGYKSVQWFNMDTTQSISLVSANWQSLIWVEVVDSNGCLYRDSLNLNILPAPVYHDSLEICTGDSTLLGGQFRNSSGFYSDYYQTSQGCDSVVYTQLNVLPDIFSGENLSICQGDSIQIGGVYRFVADTYPVTFTANSTGCDSVHSVTLTVLSQKTGSQTINICQGDSVQLSGAWQTVAGNYVEIQTAADGCDSVLTTILNVILHPITADTSTICFGDSSFIAGAWRKSAGSYDDTITVMNGCDTIRTTVLSVTPQILGSSSTTICQGDSIQLGGAWQNSSGNYTDIYQGSNGCDSTHTTTLIINPLPTASNTMSICQGDSIYLAGSWRNIAGSYLDTIKVTGGCDTLLTTSLSLITVAQTSMTKEICAYDSILVNGNFVNSPGQYQDTLQGPNSCDSLVDITLKHILVDTSITYSNGTITSGAANASFRWIDCAAQVYISGETNASFTPTANGIYAVEITQNGCVDTSGCVAVNNVAVLPPSLSEISYHPNPTRSKVKFDMGQKYGHYEVLVISMEGRILDRVTYEGDRRFNLDLSSYADGTYHVIIKGEFGVRLFKVIKED